MPILPASAAMEEGLWWLYVVTSSIFGLTVCISVWVSYVMIETQNAIDELETHVMSILDDALQILIPTNVLNHISQYDVANFEMNTEGAIKDKKTTEICYAEDVSRPLSEKSLMYAAFGDPDDKKGVENRKSKKPEKVGATTERVKSFHSVEVVMNMQRKSNKSTPAISAEVTTNKIVESLKKSPTSKKSDGKEFVEKQGKTLECNTPVHGSKTAAHSTKGTKKLLEANLGNPTTLEKSKKSGNKDPSKPTTSKPKSDKLVVTQQSSKDGKKNSTVEKAEKKESLKRSKKEDRSKKNEKSKKGGARKTSKSSRGSVISKASKKDPTAEEKRNEKSYKEEKSKKENMRNKKEGKVGTKK